MSDCGKAFYVKGERHVCDEEPGHDGVCAGPLAHTQAPPEGLSRGSVVRLLSGGPSMTVSQIWAPGEPDPEGANEKHTRAVCVWFTAAGEVRSGAFYDFLLRGVRQ